MSMYNWKALPDECITEDKRLRKIEHAIAMSLVRFAQLENTMRDASDLEHLDKSDLNVLELAANLYINIQAMLLDDIICMTNDYIDLSKKSPKQLMEEWADHIEKASDAEDRMLRVVKSN